MTHDLAAARVQARLTPRLVQCHEAIGSTNDAALAWLGAGAPPGALVVAHHQTGGRGRMGRAWHTPAGTALTCSVLLHPARAALPHVPLLGALAVVDILLDWGLRGVALKWPNDVLVGERKICGILSEAAWNGAELVGAVLGIGLNVRVEFAETPLAATAVSLEPLLGRPVDRLDLLEGLLQAIDRRLPDLGTARLITAWRSHLLTLGRMVEVTAGEQAFAGQALDVNDEGALCVQLANGEQRWLLAGDVSLRTRN